MHFPPPFPSRVLCSLLYCTELAKFHYDVLFQSKSIFLILLLTLLLLLLVSLSLLYKKEILCYHSNQQFPDSVVDDKSHDAGLHSLGTTICRLNANYVPRTMTSACTFKHGVVAKRNTVQIGAI